MNSLVDLLSITTVVGSGVVTGILLIFSNTVMPSLARHSEGAASMVTINDVILNPTFLLLFMGTTVACAALAVLTLLGYGGGGPLTLMGCGLYVVGVFGVTAAFNVPMNDALAAIPTGTPEAAEYWRVYLRRWTRWNTVRSILGIVGTTLLAAALLAAPAKGQSRSGQRAGHGDDLTIPVGSGAFTFASGPEGDGGTTVEVFFHRPATFTPESPILLVVPGAGRNADDYRNAWIGASEQHGVLIVSPSYPTAEYDFGAYHMGGLMSDMNLDDVVRREAGTNRAYLDEDRFEFVVNRRRDTWIFADFDRLFGVVARAVGSRREGYDAFGHSAGGQILHRMAIFRPDSKADRLLASNSGFFTLPNLEIPLPFGVLGTGLHEADLRRSLESSLVLFQGELDDARETGGTMLRSPTADLQGTDRMARARFAFDFARDAAARLGASFGWRLEVVPGVGHDYRRMSSAAAAYLYGAGGQRFTHHLRQDPMPTDAQDLVRRLIAAINGQDYDALPDLVAPDYVYRTPGEELRGVVGPRLLLDRAFDGLDLLVVREAELEICADALAHGRIVKALGQAAPACWRAQGTRGGGQVVLMEGVADMGEEFATFAGEEEATAQQVTG